MITSAPSQDAAVDGGAPAGAPPSAVPHRRTGRGRPRGGVIATIAALAAVAAAGGGCARPDASAQAPTEPDRTSMHSLSSTTAPSGDAAGAAGAGSEPVPATVTAPATSEPVPASTTTVPRPPNLDHRGVDLGEACADPTLLLVAAEGLDVEPPVSDLRSIRCFGDWATAWTNPVQDPVDPIDPEVLVFRRADGGWTAWRIGDRDCAAVGVPADVQLELDCY